MKRLLLFVMLIGTIATLYVSRVFVLNAAQIDVKDMDVKVIYKYPDDYDFIGYNERSRIHFEEGHIGFQNNYNTLYQEIVDGHVGKYYYVDFKDQPIETAYNDEILELCLYQNKITTEVIDTAFLKDYIHFEFDGVIEAYTYIPDGIRREYTRYDRNFRIQGDFEIIGIYDSSFIDFQIRRLILHKLRYAADDYFVNYHGVTHTNWWYARMLTLMDEIIRMGIALPNIS